MIRLGDLYVAIDDDAAYAQLPAMIAAHVGGRSGVTYHLDSAGALIDHQFSYFTPAMMQELQSRFAGDGDVWTAAGLGSGIVNKAVAMETLVPEPVFLASPLWNEFMRPHGSDTGHSLGLVHRFDGTQMVTSVHRALTAGAFTAAEVARLDTIGTDLHRIYRTRQLLGATARRARRLGDMLDTHQGIVLLVDAGLRLVEASPGGRRLLDAGDGIALREGRLVFADHCPGAAIRAAVAATVHRRPVARAAFLCPRRSGAAPWRLLVLPAGNGESLCLLLVAPAERDPARRSRWLQECFGLTCAELDVADGLLAGHTAEQIAERRQTSASTIRSHIRHLLEKTDTRRITALVALLLSSP